MIIETPYGFYKFNTSGEFDKVLTPDEIPADLKKGAEAEEYAP
jgi:hypothetical protein